MLKNKTTALSILLVFVLSFAFSVLYNTFVISGFDAFDIKLKEVGSIKVDLAEKDTYLLKVWGLEPPAKIYFNDKAVSHFYFKNNGELYEYYIKLSGEIVNERDNILNIGSALNYSAKIRNYLGRAKDKDIFLLFDSSDFLKEKELSLSKVILNAGFVVVLLSGVWLLLFFLAKRLFDSSFRKFAFGYFLSYFPCLLVLFAVYIFLRFFSCRAIIPFEIFIRLAVFLIAVVQLPVFFWTLKKIVKLHMMEQKNKLKSQEELKSPSGFKPLLVFSQWTKNRKFSDKCVCLFMALLMICVVLLIWNLELIAKWVANFAYYVLFIVVAVKFKKLMKAERQNQ